MPLSTSSFRNAPKKPWRKLLGMAFLSAFTVALLCEGTYWFLGHSPSITDSPDQWSYIRSSLAQTKNPDKAVALLGASRMLTGFHGKTFAKYYPHRKSFQLAIQARWPVAVLNELANSRFSGTAIISMTAQGFLDKFWDDQKHYTTHYHRRYLPSFDRKFNTAIRSKMQSNIRMMQASLHPKLVAFSVLKTGKLPLPHYNTTFPSRERSLDFQSKNFGIRKIRKTKGGFADKIKKWNIHHGRWLANTDKIRLMVDKIKQRGGRVVFVRLPSSVKSFTIFERYLPRQKYWDHIGKLTGGATFHFQDDPVLAKLETPDGSHIDVRDKSVLTEHLLNRLQKMGFLNE